MARIYLRAALLGPAVGGDSQGTESHLATVQAKLARADFHGSIMTVQQSKDPLLVGLSGIVIIRVWERIQGGNEGTSWKVSISSSSVRQMKGWRFFRQRCLNRTRFLYLVFRCARRWRGRDVGTVLDGPHVELELYGNHFRFRSSDRASRKFKHKESIVL